MAHLQPGSPVPPSAEEPICASSVKRYVGTALLSALLVGLPLAFTYDPGHTLDSTLVEKYEESRKFDVVFVGDSRVTRGVDPAVFESKTGLRAYNFSFPGLALSERVLAHAQRLLDPKGARILAVGVSRPSLSAMNSEGDAYTSIAEATATERWNLKTFAPLEKFIHVAPLSFSKGSRLSITAHDNGFIFTSSPTTGDGTTVRAEKLSENPRTWVSQQSLRTLAAWARRASGQGVGIVAFRMPTSQGMYELEVTKLKLDLRTVRRFLEESGVSWIETPPFSSDLRTYDGSHLDGESAARFTEELAERMPQLRR